MLEMVNTLELLSNFQLFYYNTGRFDLSNELLVVPDSDVPGREDKINMIIHKIFQHTKSHGLISSQFLRLLCLVLEDKEIKRIKNTLTELYKNFSYKRLSGRLNFEFDGISEPIGRISFLIKGSTLLNREFD